MATKHRRQHGTALIELALALPLLIIMTLLVTEFGRAMYQYHTLTKSVRDAARYLTMQTPGTKVTEAQNLAVYGNTSGSGSPLATGLTTSMVTASWPAPTGSNPAIATVNVQISGYSFQSLVNTAFGLSFGTVPFSDIRATMRSQTS